MISSINNTSPSSLLERSFYSFGKNVLGSKQVSAAVSLVFGAFVAQILTTPAGLFAAGSVYLLTENFRLKSETAALEKWVNAANSNLKDLGNQHLKITKLEEATCQIP